MPTPPRTYHGAEPPGDPEDSASTASEPVAWASIASDMVGTVIDGRYRVDALLGAGAMAFVLDGQHVHLGKRVAIKVLHPELAELGELRARFQREARAASRVTHPAVIEVTDFGVSEEGLYYLVMEHLRGMDLHRWASERGPLAADVVAGIGGQLAGALDAIHKAGFVHRDVKPENIFVLDGAEAVPAIKVLDLGIAAVSAQRPSKDDPRLTRAGQTLGTVSFMAPEQVAGRPLDGRVDIYAAGCVLFELLTGRLPFEAETATEIMMAHLREAPPDVRALRPEVPEWLAVLVARCLAKKPEDRFRDALELEQALAHGGVAPALAPMEPAEPRPSETAMVLGPSPRMRWLAMALGAALVAVIAGVILLMGPRGEREEPTAGGAGPGLVPASAGVAGVTGGTGGAAGTSEGKGSEVPGPESTRDASSASTPPLDGVEADTVGPDALAVDAGPPTGTTPEGTSDTGPDAMPEDAVVSDPPQRATPRPKTAPRTPPRIEAAPSAPTAPSPDSPRTPSGLWRPRPPGGGEQ